MNYTILWALRFAPMPLLYRLRDDGTGRLLPSDLWAFT
jgi:hypothetical protein